MRQASKYLVLATTLFASFFASADNIRIATWNLGWHVSQKEVPPWITLCSKTYAKDDQGIWRIAPIGTPMSKRGWDITESRAKLEGVDLSIMPPCSVYTTPAHQGIEVTTSAYTMRLKKISQLITKDIKPDVIAFQEVSGKQSVREALGDASAEYNVCSFDGAYKIQRLAFAWKKSLGDAIEECKDLVDISLPNLPEDQRVRPGLVVSLKLGEKKVRFLTLHLKSSCVSPLEGDRLDSNNGSGDPCPVLQQQVGPLEDALEKLPLEADHFIVLGDFNRNLWHEANKVTGAEPLRSDGETDLTKFRAPMILTRNLLLEVNDAVPAASKAILLSAVCPGGASVVEACEKSKANKLTTEERKTLASSDGLGCRNPIGLDHILVSESLFENVKSIRKVPIGSLGASLPPKPPQYPEPALAISDHCPVVMDVEF
ncbi:hypothetical protein Pres01_27520 [Metapseudomonas resinovorans]|uniref:endonuclease/exonuclease/phosphatase family protein n=1 Tax=Metapseudomonas resinovorans TaxID=53412 RepID=UPI00098519EA|nr:endonuclease/exonuclease/phosphatase family protein [Pseudomonas resinovorans]GLZ86701.1 hypothetical protein Pres01_27520 [Pseudomonas resinovorans]